jgi:hypothetical protein
LDDSASDRGGVNLTALTLPKAAQMLSAAGRRAITVDMLQADVDAGAPINPAGTINLIQYAAWLVREAFAHGD